MPKINLRPSTYVPSAELKSMPIVGQSMKTAPDVSSGLLSISKGLEDVADLGARIEEKRSKWMVNHNILKLHQEANDALNELRNDPDPDGSYDRWEKKVSGFYSERKRTIERSAPRAAQAFDDAYETLFTQLHGQAGSIVNGKKLEQMRVGTEDDINQLLTDAANAPYDDRGQKQFNIGIVAAERKINDMVGTLWTADHATSRNKSIRIAAQRLRLNGMAASNPRLALQYIDQGNFNLLSNDEVQVFRREIAAKARTDALAEKANLETAVYGNLFSRYRGDPKAMRAALMNPETMQEYGITIDNAKSIENAIADHEKTSKANTETVEVGYLNKLVSRQLTENEVAADVRGGKIDAKTGEHWINSIRSHRDQYTDPVTFARLHDRVTRGEASIDEIMKSGGLSQTDKKALVDKASSKTTGNLNDAERQAKEVLKGFIIRTSDMGFPIHDPESYGNLQKAYQALDEWRMNFQKEGRQWDQKTLAEYNDFVSGLSKTYQSTFIGQMESMKKALQKTKQKTGQQPPAVLPRQSGESITDYIKRTSGGGQQ
jgi:hypothetical protein